MGLFQKVMTYKLCQNASFKNGGTTIQMGILHVFFDFSLTVKAAPHECEIRTGQP